MTVLERAALYLCEQCGCDPDEVELAARFDDLNVADFEREHLAFLLTEAYDVDIPADELFAFDTLEDLIGYVEDRL